MAETSRSWSWCKVSVRVLTDPKVMKAARRAGPSVHGVLLWMLTTNSGGGYEGAIPFAEWDAESVAMLLGTEPEDVQRAFDELTRSGFVTVETLRNVSGVTETDASIVIPGWSKWRPESPSTDRVRAWRERKSFGKSDETLRNVSRVSVTQEEKEERRVEEIDSGARSPDHTEDGSDAKAADARKAAESLADTFRPFLLAVDPSNPIRDKGTWSVKRAEGVGPLVRLLGDYDRDHIGAVMAWAMRDATPGKNNWRGWKFKIGSLADFERHFAEIRKSWVEATASPAFAAPSPLTPPADPKEGDWWHPEWRPIPAGFYVASGHLRRTRERPQRTSTGAAA